MNLKKALDAGPTPFFCQCLPGQEGIGSLTKMIQSPRFHKQKRSCSLFLYFRDTSNSVTWSKGG